MISVVFIEAIIETKVQQLLSLVKHINVREGSTEQNASALDRKSDLGEPGKGLGEGKVLPGHRASAGTKILKSMRTGHLLPGTASISQVTRQP